MYNSLASIIYGGRVTRLKRDFGLDLEEMFEMDMRKVMHHRRNGCPACHLGPMHLQLMSFQDMRKHWELEGAASKIAELDLLISTKPVTV